MCSNPPGRPAVPDEQTVRIWRALAAEANDLMTKHKGRQASDPWPPLVDTALRMLELAIAAIGVPVRDTQYAVTQWRIQRLPIEECVAQQQTEEARTTMRWKPPRELRPAGG